MDHTIPLSELPVGSVGRVCGLTANGGNRRRMLDLGLIDGTLVKSLMRSPAGDPTAYKIRGAVIALRAEDSRTVQVLADT